MEIHWLDYLLLAIVLSISLLIGVVTAFLQRKKTNTQEVINGTRSHGAFPVALSLVASYLSAISMLGNPAEIYINGTTYFYLILSMNLVMITCAVFYIPVLYKSNVETSFQYLEFRYDKREQILCSIIFLLQTIVFMGIVLYAPCLAINQATGFELWGVVVVVGVVCTIYTAIGGISAVLWTDVFQSIIMCGCLLIVIIKGTVDFGSFSKVWQINVDGGRVVFDNFSTDATVPYTVWSVVFGGYFTWLTLFGTSPAMVQRMLSCKTRGTAILAFGLGLLGLNYVLLTTFLNGVVLFAEYGFCNPTGLKGGITTSDQILPYYVANKFKDSPGVLGIFIAGIIAASLSTISSGTNSLVSVLITDVFENCMSKWSDSKKMWFSKLLVLITGMSTILFAYVSSFLGPLVKIAISIFGMLSGPIGGVFTAGMLLPFANSKGAFYGHVLSTIVTVFIGVGRFFYAFPAPRDKIDPATCMKDDSSLGLLSSARPENNFSGIQALFQVSFLYHGSIGFILAFIFIAIISALTKGNLTNPVDSRLLHSIAHRFMPDHQYTHKAFT